MLTVTSPADSVVVENRIKDAFKEVRLSAKIELRMKAQSWTRSFSVCNRFFRKTALAFYVRRV